MFNKRDLSRFFSGKSDERLRGMVRAIDALIADQTAKAAPAPLPAPTLPPEPSIDDQVRAMSNTDLHALAIACGIEKAPRVDLKKANAKTLKSVRRSGKKVETIETEVLRDDNKRMCATIDYRSDGTVVLTTVQRDDRGRIAGTSSETYDNRESFLKRAAGATA